MNFAYFHSCLSAAVLLGLALFSSEVLAQNSPVVGGVAASSDRPVVDRGVGDWLMRVHEASRNRAYMGTFVVSSSAGSMASARIWHVCDGEKQMERVETLTGEPRSTFRRNDEVVTFWPQSKVARTEKRDGQGLFPSLLKAPGSPLAEFYVARAAGSERVAGYDADVVTLQPRDNLRYGYRVWSEKKTGLLVKLQTLDGEGRVLEQAAFSELQLDAPVKMEKLTQMMANTEGYKVERSQASPTTAVAEGWVLKTPVAGFQPMSCLKRPVASGSAGSDGTMQWVFSDGLASVSVFVQAYDRQRHATEGLVSLGATQTLSKRIQDWWLTAVGEVPAPTLKLFAQGLERTKPSP